MLVPLYRDICLVFFFRCVNVKTIILFFLFLYSFLDGSQNKYLCKNKSKQKLVNDDCNNKKRPCKIKKDNEKIVLLHYFYLKYGKKLSF